MNKEIKRIYVIEGIGSAALLLDVFQALRGYANRPVRIIIESIDRPGEGLLGKGVEIRNGE